MSSITSAVPLRRLKSSQLVLKSTLLLGGGGGGCALLRVAVSHFFVMSGETKAQEVNAEIREKSKIYGN